MKRDPSVYEAKRGRPKGSRNADRKPARLHVRLTDDELEQFKKAAASKGKSASEWARDILNAAS